MSFYYLRIEWRNNLAYCDYIKQCRRFIEKDTFAYIMPRERSIDIDNEMDLKLARSVIRNNI